MLKGLKVIQSKSSVKHNSPFPIDDIKSILNKDLSFRKKRLSNKAKESLYHELSILLSAGIDIKVAFELISDQTENQGSALIYSGIKQYIIDGSSLHEALKCTKLFTPYEYYSIKIGEETGRLTQILAELALYYSRKIKQNRQIIQALSYPIIVLATSIGAVGFMISFIVPMFADVFKRFGGELPYLTTIIIKLSRFFIEYFWLFILILLGLSLALFFFKQKKWYKKVASRFILMLPFIGDLVLKIYLTRMCFTLSLLVGSRIPLLQAVGLVKQIINFYPIEEALAITEADILNGESLHRSFSKFKIFDSRLTTLVKVGEEVNKLESFFLKLSHLYNDEVEYKTTVLSSFMEPLIIIFLGLVVSIILLAMYLPMFQLSTSM